MITEIIKIIISATTPVAVVVIGVILLRKIEGIKAEVARGSEFTSKWAGEFWTTCNDFMKCTERYMAILNYLQFLPKPNEDEGLRRQKECNKLIVKIDELEVRIRRMVLFAPTNGTTVKNHALNIISMLKSLAKTQKGSFDPLAQEISNFNKVTKDAHAEMMGIRDSQKIKEIKTEFDSGKVL